MRSVRVCFPNTWARGREEVDTYIRRAAAMDVVPFLTRRDDASLAQKARLDCDWYAENARCFGAIRAEGIDFLGAWVVGAGAILDIAKPPPEPGEERWLITMAHQPQALGPLAGRVFALLAKAGIRHLYYAFDEASRFMPCFADIAPHLDVLIHDESPLDGRGAAALKPGCRRIHRSWVANVIPFAAPFHESPEQKIVFLGSELGLTPHRQRQIDFLRTRFKDRFVAIHDHSVSVAERFSLNRFKVSLCPEGRKFTTPAMSRTHTDRPFWSGCLGMVPVAENSRAGDRLNELTADGLIVRYDHGDLRALAEACERALAMTTEERRRIYDHFNRHETVGSVVADAIAAS